MRAISDQRQRGTAGVHGCAPRTIAVLAFALAALLPGAASANQSGTAHATQYGASVALAPQESAMASRIGRPDSMDELVRRLLHAVGDLSGYQAQDDRPQVTRIPLSELQRRLCGGPCAVRAAYVPGEGLYIDETLRPDLNAYHQSILFHELVHHVQEEHGLHAELDGCNRWRLREVEAYRLQNRFLAAVGAHVQALDPGLPCAADSANAFEEPKQ
ncbi:MAG TPA: hypothetical protein VIA64_03890 [Burkholderiales bacterium]|jgi:hypothetical protein